MSEQKQDANNFFTSFCLDNSARSFLTSADFRRWISAPRICLKSRLMFQNARTFVALRVRADGDCEKRSSLMKTEEILTRLEGVFGTSNGWQARCPAHNDSKASLSIAEDDGKTL